MMLDLFRSELDAHLPVLSSGLLALEKSDASKADVNAMMRAAHSVKGAARIVGLAGVVDVAHVLEDCFTAAHEKRITLTQSSVDDLLAAVDLIAVLAASPDASVEQARVRSVIDRVAAIRDAKPHVAITISGGLVPIELPERLDFAACETLRLRLLPLVRTGGPICFDASRVRSASSSFVALLSVIAASGCRLEMMNATHSIDVLLRLVNLGSGDA